MLDCTPRLIHWFWIVESEKTSTTAHDKATSKIRTLDSRQNPPVFAQAHANLLPPSLFPPVSQIQYLCTAEGQGGRWHKAPSTKQFHSCVSHWMIWSICQSPVRSTNGKKLRQCPVDLLGLLMKISPLCSQLLLPPFAALCLSSTSAVCICKTNLSGQISPLL